MPLANLKVSGSGSDAHPPGCSARRMGQYAATDAESRPRRGYSASIR